MLTVGKLSAAHFSAIARQGVADLYADIGVLLDVTRRLGGVHSDHFVVDQHLAVAGSAGADADRCDRHAPGDLGADLARHRFHHHGEAAGGGNRQGVANQLLRCCCRPALHAITAGQVLGLRLQTDVAHHRNAGRHDGGDGSGTFHAALQLHRRATSFLDQAHGVGDRIRHVDLVGAERQVADHEGSRPRPADRAAMVQHLLHRDRHRAGIAEHERAEAVPHQDHVYTGAVGEACAVKVVGGDHRQTRNVTRALGYISDRDLVAFHGGSSAIGLAYGHPIRINYRQRRGYGWRIGEGPGAKSLR